MSHITRMVTNFSSLMYLGRALSSLGAEIDFLKTVKIDKDKPFSIPVNFNGSKINFDWNGKQFDLNVDTDHWKNSFPIENFLQQLTQSYTNQLIIGESVNKGFQVLENHKEQDGSIIIYLEKWETIK